ncbi:MAG: AI-2E family transporter [Pseudomonadota bacterium]|nr:AI-2E family transporter [Pseudomonadota bacterium]
MTQPIRVAPVKDRFYARTFALVTCFVLGWALFKIVQPFLGPLLWAIFIAFLLYPLHVRLAARLRGKAQWSAALLTVLTFIVIIGPLTALSAAFAAQVGDLLQIVQDKVTDQTSGNVLNLANVPWVRQGLDWLNDTLDVDLAQVQGWFTQGSREALQTLASLTGKVFMGAVGTAVGFVLMEFMLFFFIRDGGEMVSTTRELIPMAEAPKARLFDHLAAVTRAMVYGTGLTSLIQGALVGIAFLIVGLPSPIVFGVIAALVALLPFGGTALVWGPAALVLAAQSRWGATIFMLIWGTVLVSLVDNVVRPMLVSGRANVGTLTVFIGVLGGLAAFGAIGLFLGPVILALIIALIRFRLELRQAEKAEKTEKATAVSAESAPAPSVPS